MDNPKLWEEVTDPRYQQQVSWTVTHEFEYHLLLAVAAVLIILAVARYLLWKKN